MSSSPSKVTAIKSALNVITTHFLKERETKGAVRYMQVTGPDANTEYSILDGAEIGMLYMRKSAFNGIIPDRLIVTVTV